MPVRRMRATSRWIGAVLVAAIWCPVARATIEGSPSVEPFRLASDARVVVFAPHPDDETIAVGGLLHRLATAHAAVQVVFVTNGDGYPDAVSRSIHGRT